MSTIHDQRYIQMIENLVRIRNEKSITQIQLAKQLKKRQSYISKIEILERRIDAIELFDWLTALNVDQTIFFHELCKNLKSS